MWFYNGIPNDSTGFLLMGTVGGQGMRRPLAMAGVFNVFRTRAAEHAWWPSPSPQPPSSPALRERKGEGGTERKNAGNPLTSESHGRGTS